MTLELEALRAEITTLDNQILELLEERMEHAQNIGTIKKEKGLPVQDLNREAEVIRQRKLHSSLPEEFVEKLFTLIIKESRRVQEDDA